MFLEVEHRLALEYDGFIAESHLELRVRPKPTSAQTVHSFLLAVGPSAKVDRYTDWNGNVVHHFSIAKFHRRVEALSRSLVATHPAVLPLADLAERPPLRDLPYELWNFLQLDGPLRPGPRLRAFHRSLGVPATAPVGEQVARLAERIAGEFAYQKHVTRYDSTTEEFLRLQAGVCQDFAHLMLACLRLRKIPCRYVSGYLHVDRRESEPAQSHAWIEAYSPAHGWVPFDPTHDRPVDERYVVVAHGRHYDDVPPNKGIFKGNARETLTAEVVTRPSSPKAISTLQEEIRQIDLPVFQEIGEPRREHVIPPSEEAEAQQQ